MGFNNKILEYYKNLFGDTKKEETKSVSYLGLFKYADVKDKMFALFGIIAAMGNGVLMPLIFILYGNATDAFVQTSFCFLLDYNISAFCPPEVNDGNINDLYFKCNLSFFNVTLPDKNLVSHAKTQGAYMTIVGFGTWVLSWMEIVFLTLSAERQTLKLRKKVFHSILYKDVQWFDSHSAGSINSYLVQNANKYKDGVGDKIGLIFQAMITAVASVIMGFVKGWKLTLVILATSPLLMLSSALMTKVSTRSTNIETKAYANAGSVAQEALSNIRTVHSFNGVSKMEEKYGMLLNDAKREGIKKGITNGLMMGILWIVVFLVYALGFWYSGKLNRDENQSIGALLIVFIGVQNAVYTLGNTTPHYHSVVEAKAAAHDLHAIIGEPSQIESKDEYAPRLKKRTKSLSEPAESNLSVGVIEFKNVKFSYPSRPEVTVLNNFNLKINQGQTVALVGESGSGKSTVVQLLLRFYDPSQGCILLNGRDIKTIAPNILRKYIGLVSQEPVLFSTTIAENIRLGNENITDDQIESACKKANAHEFIKSLPDKYETFVGESGTQLSGGQKQRIAIARALIHDPKILLLDEATSALDSESEKYVQEALEIASKGRTAVVIAHRLSTVRNADVIIGMDKGTVIESGAHEELMEERGLYFKLFNIQSRGHDVHVAQAYNMEKRRTHTQKSMIEEKENDVDDEKEEEESMSSLLYVLKKNSPEIIFILIGCFCCIIWGVIQTLYEFYYAKFVTSFSHCNLIERQKTIDLCSVVYVVFGVVSFCTQLIIGYVFAVSGERLTKRLRLQLFNAILRQDISYFDKDENNVGTLCTMLSTEASAVQGATGIRIGVVLSNLAILGIALLIAFIFGWELCLVILIFIPFLILGGVLSTKLIAGFTAKDKKLLENAGKVVMEVSANIKTVKQLRKEEYFFTKYTDIVTEAYHKTKNKCLITGFLYGLSQAILDFAIAAGYYAGAEFVTKGRMTTEEMMFVFGCLVFGAMSVGQNQAMAPDFGKARAAAAKLHRTIEMQPDVDSLSIDGLTLPNVKGDITFRNIKFEYPSRPGIQVLRDLNINIRSGCSVAFVGSSGCGKSTTIQLLQRFYDPVNGKIQLDNDNIEKMNIQWYRKQLGVVGQEPALFNWSIAENIAFGDTSREVTIDEIKAACKISNVDTFIESLPEGYDTVVGSKGTLISGGQKQRIAIARALIRNPKVLLLDEATSALDTESEIVVQEALDRAQKNRTCISIAHRLSTIVHCDEIFVFKDGIIVERGTHDELIAKKGIYFDLYSLSAR